MARKYELTIILSPDTEEDEEKAVLSRIKELIETNNGEVIEVDRWGKRKLAYEINDFTEGIYNLVKFTGETNFITELERVVRLLNPVIRCLVINVE